MLELVAQYTRSDPVAIAGLLKAREFVWCNDTNRLGMRVLRCKCEPCRFKRWDGCLAVKNWDMPAIEWVAEWRDDALHSISDESAGLEDAMVIIQL